MHDHVNKMPRVIVLDSQFIQQIQVTVINMNLQITTCIRFLTLEWW